MREIDSQDMPIFTFRDAEIPQKKEAPQNVKCTPKVGHNL